MSICTPVKDSERYDCMFFPLRSSSRFKAFKQNRHRTKNHVSKMQIKYKYKLQRVLVVSSSHRSQIWNSCSKFHRRIKEAYTCSTIMHSSLPHYYSNTNGYFCRFTKECHQNSTTQKTYLVLHFQLKIYICKYYSDK